MPKKKAKTKEVKPRLVGKPRKFNSPDDLRDVLQKYFDVTPRSEWTVTGLSLVVGSKQLLNDYEAREGFKELVEEAKLVVENDYEKDLKREGKTGSIFALKNFGWKDKTETDLTTGGEKLTGFEYVKPGIQNKNRTND